MGNPSATRMSIYASLILVFSPPLSSLSRKWWAWQDLNLWPRAYQARALTNWATGPLVSNTQPLSLVPYSRGSCLSVFGVGVLLSPFMVEARGLEPRTCSLQSCRSTSWAIPPLDSPSILPLSPKSYLLLLARAYSHHLAVLSFRAALSLYFHINQKPLV